MSDTVTISFLPLIDKLEKPHVWLCDKEPTTKKEILNAEFLKVFHPGIGVPIDWKQYVKNCTLAFHKAGFVERYDERDDDTLDGDEVIDNCFYCGKPITVDMMRHVDAISYSWTHKDGTPVIARCCWGDCDVKIERDLHPYYLKLCGLTEQEYRERLKKEQPGVWQARVDAGMYKEA